MGVTAVSSVKYMWRLNETPRGRRWELNSLELRAKQPWLCTEELQQSSAWDVLTHTGQLDHVPLLVQCFIECLPEQGYPLPLTMLSCDCGYPLLSGEHTREQPCLRCTRPHVRVPLCWICPCVGKRWHCAEAPDRSWALEVPSSTSMAPITAGWAASHRTRAVVTAIMPSDF